MFGMIYEVYTLHQSNKKFSVFNGKIDRFGMIYGVNTSPK
jgi:hypothetical protein